MTFSASFIKALKRPVFITMLAVLLILPAIAIAQDNNDLEGFDDLMPPQAAQNDPSPMVFAPEDATHPAIKLTPDKSEMIRLDSDATSIVVGNESHIQVLMDSPQRIIIVPRMPGATFFTILDKDGNVLMQRHAIVASPKEKYVRIRRSCNGTGGCEETSVYYCPGMCHNVQIQTNTSTRQSQTNLLSGLMNGFGGLGSESTGGGGEEVPDFSDFQFPFPFLFNP